jgi:hypothetical protein
MQFRMWLLTAAFLVGMLAYAQVPASGNPGQTPPPSNDP